MARTASRMYVPLDTNFFDDAKVVEAGETAAWLFLNMLTKAKQLDKDGLITRAQVERLAVKSWQRRLDRCVEVGLIEQTLPGVFVITRWGKWNETKDQREVRLKADRDRKAEKNGGGNR